MSVNRLDVDYETTVINHAGMNFELQRVGRQIICNCYVTVASNFNKEGFDAHDVIPDEWLPNIGYMEIPLIRAGRVEGSIRWNSDQDDRWELSSNACDGHWVTGFAIWPGRY